MKKLLIITIVLFATACALQAQEKKIYSLGYAYEAWKGPNNCKHKNHIGYVAPIDGKDTYTRALKSIEQKYPGDYKYAAYTWKEGDYVIAVLVHLKALGPNDCDKVVLEISAEKNKEQMLKSMQFNYRASLIKTEIILDKQY